jgi:hypothetical protein
MVDAAEVRERRGNGSGDAEQYSVHGRKQREKREKSRSYMVLAES